MCFIAQSFHHYFIGSVGFAEINFISQPRVFLRLSFEHDSRSSLSLCWTIAGRLSANTGDQNLWNCELSHKLGSQGISRIKPTHVITFFPSFFFHSDTHHFLPIYKWFFFSGWLNGTLIQWSNNVAAAWWWSSAMSFLPIGDRWKGSLLLCVALSRTACKMAAIRPFFLHFSRSLFFRVFGSSVAFARRTRVRPRQKRNFAEEGKRISHLISHRRSRSDRS